MFVGKAQTALRQRNLDHGGGSESEILKCPTEEWWNRRHDTVQRATAAQNEQFVGLRTAKKDVDRNKTPRFVDIFARITEVATLTREGRSATSVARLLTLFHTQT